MEIPVFFALGTVLFFAGKFLFPGSLSGRIAAVFIVLSDLATAV